MSVAARRLQALRVVAAAGFGAAFLASCGVDQSGLGSMQFLPHDAAAGGATGAAGAGNSVGTGGTGGTGGVVATGVGGGGNDVGGAAGTVGAAGTGGNATGAAGTGGAAGTTGAAGATATAGTSGAAGTGGTGGTVGTTGSAGTSGSAGTTGAGGTGGSAGTIGTAGTTGGGGLGGAGGMAGLGGGSGGSGGISLGGRGGINLGGRGGTTPCTATTCADGCCKDTFTCIRMRSAMQCGAQGATCTPCGGCQTCSTTGQCRIDPMSRWTITAVSAQLTGGGWDRGSGEIGGSAPDPFCEFENPAGQVTPTTAGTTDTITDDTTPMWNQVITPAGMTVAASTLMATNPTWQIWVGDDDGCPASGCTADVACTIRQQISESTLRSGELVITNRQSCAQVTLDFTCQP